MYLLDSNLFYEYNFYAFYEFSSQMSFYLGSQGSAGANLQLSAGEGRNQQATSLSPKAEGRGEDLYCP